MSYVDGFVAAVPAANEEAYRRHAAEAAPLFKEFGATRVVECWGDDVPAGTLNDFQRSVKAGPDEVIVYSWIEYPSRDVRNRAGEKMMTDPRMEQMGATMPFDAKRMIYGGFALLFEGGGAGTMGYVDGSVIPVPDGNREAYHAFCSRSAELFREFGATRIVDALGDDVPDGKITDFKGAVKAEAGETVALSWIEWPSRAARDAGWARAMADPRMMEGDMPFDGRRMIHGGFRPILDV